MWDCSACGCLAVAGDVRVCPMCGKEQNVPKATSGGGTNRWVDDETPGEGPVVDQPAVDDQPDQPEQPEQREQPEPGRLEGQPEQNQPDQPQPGVGDQVPEPATQEPADTKEDTPEPDNPRDEPARDTKPARGKETK